MSGGKRIRARIVVYTAPREEKAELLLLDESWLDKEYPHYAERLWEEGIKGDTKVAIPLRLVPTGVAVRKPYGGMKYRPVDDRYAFVPCKEGQVVVADHRACLHLEDGDKPWVVQLSDVMPHWSRIKESFRDMRCPK